MDYKKMEKINSIFLRYTDALGDLAIQEEVEKNQKDMNNIIKSIYEEIKKYQINLDIVMKGIMENVNLIVEDRNQAYELLRDIRDDKVNAQDEADKFLRDHIQSKN